MHSFGPSPGATPLWINARFLTRAVTGVERVAMEVIGQWAKQMLPDGTLPVGQVRLSPRLIAPRTARPLVSPWPTIPLVQAGRLSGHLWEQLELPFLTAGTHLLSLCNTGPVFKRRHWIFLHDAQTFAIPENFRPSVRWWYRLLFVLCSRNSRAILTNSCFSKDELARYLRLPRRRIHVAWLGADHMARISAEPPSAGIRQALADLQDRPFVLCVASHNPNKNFSLVTQALRQMGDEAPACLVVGKPGGQVFAGTDPHDAGMAVLGYVTDAELAGLYRQAQALLFPSFYEGFGLPPLEAMWFGCPAIVSRTSAMPEVCGDAALYCDPHSAASLAQAIRQLLQHPEEQARRKRLAEERAQQFTWEQTAMTIARVCASHP